MKAKHNKKRNTAFLYEVLVKELTRSIVEKDPERKVATHSILREYFGKNSILREELQHYRNLLETSGLKEILAEKLLQETKLAHSTLDSKGIFDQQTRLINKINKALSKEVWNSFVPNYKSLASVSTIFNTAVSPKQRILQEEKIIELISSSEGMQEEALQPMDNIIYQAFVKKFNEHYVGLLEEQKALLGKYIASFTDNGLDLKLYLNEEIGRLKRELTEALALGEIQADKGMLGKSKKIIAMLEGFKKSAITEELVSKILRIQHLVRETGTHD